jgi:hypothetical protein
MDYTLSQIEIQLKKRHAYPYKWYQKQNNLWDGYTQFIYGILDWELVLEEINKTYKKHELDKHALFYYASNRWYNYWSAVAVEQIFNLSHKVVPATNSKDKTKDFKLLDIAFDHKTSVYPKGFLKPVSYAKANKRELILWLYKNQSKQQRYHTKNRLFVVVYETNQEHWKLKAEIGLLKTTIQNYLSNFDARKLQKFNFTAQTQTVSDIIWVTR